MNKLVIKLSLVLLPLLAVGCSKNAEIEEFIKANDEFASELKKKGAKDPDAALKHFDEKEGDLKAKFDAIKDVRGFQTNEETQTKLVKSVADATMDVCGLQISLKAGKKEKELCDRYTGLLDFGK